MILPQSEAYATLQRRLASIPPATKLISKLKLKINHSSFDFNKLLKHFHVVQEQHREYKRKQRMNSLIERNISHTDA